MHESFDCNACAEKNCVDYPFHFRAQYSPKEKFETVVHETTEHCRKRLGIMIDDTNPAFVPKRTSSGG